MKRQKELIEKQQKLQAQQLEAHRKKLEKEEEEKKAREEEDDDELNVDDI